MILLLGVVVSCQSQSAEAIKVIDKTFLVENVVGKEVQFIDVRTEQEYQKGHIDGAVNFNIFQTENFLRQITTLNKNKPVYLYCKMGVRSHRAAKLMQERGFTKIFDYSGGYNDWQQE